ncbi:hypothetical protein XELAEV_18008255mg [Xenopus laevis]|uniref:Uncharacterized protein n=1 Tax=Xenopus laevis TaxID=8355 RepID=A0A974E3D1_XENLA|nr:hypothetical protein XELAEV_18008255mg [Xenopus laevis]
MPHRNALALHGQLRRPELFWIYMSKSSIAISFCSPMPRIATFSGKKYPIYLSFSPINKIAINQPWQPYPCLYITNPTFHSYKAVIPKVGGLVK